MNSAYPLVCKHITISHMQMSAFIIRSPNPASVVIAQAYCIINFFIHWKRLPRSMKRRWRDGTTKYCTKKVQYVYSNSSLCPSDLLVEVQRNAVGCDGKRCSLLVQQFAMCEGKWWMSISSSLWNKILIYGALRRRFIFLFFSFLSRKLFTCIPLRGIYIVFVDDAFDVCGGQKHIYANLLHLISEWIKIILCIEIASHQIIMMKNVRRNFMSKFFYAMPQITFNSFNFTLTEQNETCPI